MGIKRSSDLFPDGQVLIATANRGKAQEFAQMFAAFGVVVKTLNDFADPPHIVEDGATFAENALIKARTVALAYGVPALADDSGLCVDLLGGEPGVYSARYAGPGASDAANNAKLLAALTQLADAGGAPAAPPGNHPRLLSQAHFACALALFEPASELTLAAFGRCDGWIAAAPRGSFGFGYDPLFYLPELGCTMAELPSERKNEISHRSHAIRALWPQLEQESDSHAAE
ncbi:MAG: purine phosphatase [Paenibacillaceae bacterium]|jgi:XTP/dITP diphosphohydrolase|nr:purine phosphatase [Paenibacillaceae bacterium]